MSIHHHGKSFPNNQNKQNFNGNSSTYNQNSNRGRGGNRGRARGRGGGRAPFQVTGTPNKENNDPQQPCESLNSNHKVTKIKKYDQTKIPEKLDHFGEVSEDIHRQLQSQLIRSNIEIESDN